MTDPRSGEQHLHPTVRAYVRDEQLATDYDRYFAGLALFQFDCEFIDRHLTAPGVVLDLGCGTGRHLAYLEARGHLTCGLDLSAPMLREARANLQASNRPVRLVRGDFHRLPLVARPVFDAILMMFSTLGLIDSSAKRQTVLEELRTRLRPGGCFLAHVHNRNYHYGDRTGRLAQARDYLRRLAGLSEPGDSIMRNYRGRLDLFLHSFDRAEIESLLARSGYRLRELLPLNEERNGPCAAADPDHQANGFLICAEAKV